MRDARLQHWPPGPDQEQSGDRTPNLIEACNARARLMLPIARAYSSRRPCSLRLGGDLTTISLVHDADEGGRQ